MSSKKTVAIVQSNYIPWKGYFDLIRLADEFILLDDVQYTRRDWRNRNKIKTKDGLKWLTIPVDAKGKFFQSIRETQVSDPSWPRQHFSTICQAYAKAPFLQEYKPFLEEMFLGCECSHLSAINERFLRTISSLLGIHTPLRQSSEFKMSSEKTDRLLSICRQAGADRYLSGPAAQSYLDEKLFADAGIEVVYMDYGGYAEYQQLYPPFEHGVSIIDAILNLGSDAIMALDRSTP